LHKLPAQHGLAVELDVDVPGVPQTAHRFELLQIVFAAVQVEPVQQGCPAPPHGTQVLELVLQAVPGSRHAPPVDEDEQHACPVLPHSLQT
jgi:hypothetical protein